MVVVIRVLGVKEKKEADEKKMKLILSTIHLTQVAFFGRKITGEDDLSHHVQQMRGREIVVNDGVEASK